MVSSVKGWQCGKTKVFLRYFHMDELNRKFLPFPLAAQSLSKVSRGYLARRRTRVIIDRHPPRAPGDANRAWPRENRGAQSWCEAGV